MELARIDNGKIIVAQELSKEIADFEKRALEVALKKKELSATIKQLMEDNGIYETIENDYLKIVYKKSYPRTTIDSKKLKEELPDIYEEYSKTTNVSSSITIEAK